VEEPEQSPKRLDVGFELVAIIRFGKQHTRQEGAERHGHADAVLGDAILTADGSRWRWQRHAVASIFRQERIRGFLPAMLGAAERTRDRWLSYPPGVEIDVAREMMLTTLDIILSTILPERNSIDCSLIPQSITDYLEPITWTTALAMIRAPRWVPYPGMGDDVVALPAPNAMHELSCRRACLNFIPFDDPLSIQWPDPRVPDRYEPPDFGLRVRHRNVECRSQVAREVSLA
jgi:hypothetical protein